MFKRAFATIFTLFLVLVFSGSALGAGNAQEKLLKKFNQQGFTLKSDELIYESEPNNDFHEANQILAGDSILGTLSDEDYDVYQFSMDMKGTFSAATFLGNDPEDSSYYIWDYNLAVFDGNGNEVASGNYDYFYDEDSYSYIYLRYLDVELEKGTYYVAVKADDYSSLGSQKYFLLTYADYKPDFSVSSITSNVASPQVEGKTITFTAKSSTIGLEYKYYVNGKQVRDFSSANTYSWKASTPGTFKIKVEARNPDYPKVIASREITYVISKYKPDFSISSISTSLKSPQILGKTITFTANTNKSGLQYQYYVDNKVVQKFGSNKTYKWKPGKIGKYKIKVGVRRTEYPNSIVFKEISYEVKDPNVKIQSLKPSLSSPSPTSKSIKWTAKATGVDLQYKFSVKQNNKWVTLKKYSSSKTYTWKPKTAGSYQIKVDIKSKASGKSASKIVKYTIFKPSAFSITSFKSSKKSPVMEGTNMNFSAKASGKYLEYRFRVYSNGYWDTYKDYSSSKSFNFTPYGSGKYKIVVDVRQKGTTKKKTKTITIDVKESPSWQMNMNYNISSNSGYFLVQNKGYKNLTVTKFEMINNGKVIYTHKPKNWIVIGKQSEYFYFYPKNPVTKFNYDTYIKVTFQYDGISHTGYLYRGY
ncbi:triple tyrosine motif-containing protein [Mesobacillus thioparans]|uniref:triple tyrosine motif-containing protein n=1 Tax=Mesobacillus thioparans TaxID=370439 RepID=UPI0039F04A1D